MSKYIAPRSLGSASDTKWERKNYTIEHSSGGLFGEGDADSLYRGVFYGFPFITEILGADGDWSVYQTSSPSHEMIAEEIKYDDGSLQIQGDCDIDEAPETSMPSDMRNELAIAMLNHHNAQYSRWQREEERYEF